MSTSPVMLLMGALGGACFVALAGEALHISAARELEVKKLLRDLVRKIGNCVLGEVLMTFTPRRMRETATWLGLMMLLWQASCAPTEAAELEVTNKQLRVSLAVPSGLVTVRDLRNGMVWRQYIPIRSAQGRDWGAVTTNPVPADSLVRLDEAVAGESEIAAKATWRGHPFDIVYRLDPDEAALSVTVDTLDRNVPLPWKPGWAGVVLMKYPYAFHHEAAGAEAVVPVDEGVRYSTRETDPAADPTRWRAWWLHQKLSMPWWGVTDGQRGVMTTVDTPYDCMFSVDWVNTPQGERTLPHVTWIASKRALAYPRRMTFRFFAEGGYVQMAKAFRRQMIADGRFRSWEDKVRANPAVERLRGALDLWHWGTIGPELIAQLQAAGVRRAIVAKVGRGDPTLDEGIEPAAIEAADTAGFLIGKYHNYSWIQGRWIDKDPTLRDLAIVPADGKLVYKETPWDAKGHLFRCPAVAAEVFRRQGGMEHEFGLNYFFLDTTTTGGSVLECYHPDHPLARAQASVVLSEVLESTTSLGLVVGSERGKWWAAPETHVFEGIETLSEYGGTYYGKAGTTHWVGPYLKDKPGHRELCLGYDFNPARRLPLFQLVYHDSVYCTRRWNQDPGRDRTLWDRHDLMNILYGTPPLVFMHPEAGNALGTPTWSDVKDRYLQTYRTVCGWHEKIGFDEMTDHRVLSDDRLVQETKFSSGWAVVVNFGEEPWEDPRGFSVAGHGYHSLESRTP